MKHYQMRLLLLIALLIASLLCGCGAPAVQEQPSAPAEAQNEQPPEQTQVQQTPLTFSEDAYWQNNGGYFLGLDQYIFFREYTKDSFSEPMTFGDFLWYPQPDTTVTLRVYDTETHSFAAEYSDDGMGGLWYADGLIWSQYSDGENFHVYTFTPDGQNRNDVTFGEVKGVSGSGKLVCIYGSEPGSVPGRFSLWQNGEMVASVEPSESESFLPCGFDNETYLFAAQDSATESTYIRQLDASGKVLTLGELPAGEESAMSLPEFVQFVADGEDAYLLFAWYEGSGHFFNKACAVKVTLGKENSLEEFPLSDSEAGLEENPDKPPVLFLGGPGDLVVVPEKPETIQLSEVTYGDLVFTDSPFSAIRLVSDFIPEDPYENGGKIIQTSEVVGDSLYLMVADCSREPDFDIGWRAAFGMKELSYLRIPIREGSAVETLIAPDAQG
ncbi:MAG: hypothetical protein Q3977_03830 [Oscillospiraceae bacterium]|nr:hypothetical protein [Oscillospiraceae bacterium]